MGIRVLMISYFIWGLPKVKGTFLKVPIIRSIIYGVYICVPLFKETTISQKGTARNSTTRLDSLKTAFILAEIVFRA